MKLKIEVWSDYVCPFCYIGKKNLDEALKQLGRKDDIEVIFKSFELDPNAPKQIDGTINELIAKKYGMSIEAATENNNKIVESARQIGLELDFDNLKPTNTFDAHRLSFYAKEENNPLDITVCCNIVLHIYNRWFVLSDKLCVATVRKR